VRPVGDHLADDWRLRAKAMGRRITQGAGCRGNINRSYRSGRQLSPEVVRRGAAFWAVVLLGARLVVGVERDSYAYMAEFQSIITC